MKLAAMQPYFFPYLGYFQCIAAVDKYILYDHLAYIKDGWIHRNRVLVPDGKPVYITVRLQDKSSYTKIKDIKLFDHPSWRKKILHSIFLFYRNCLFFDEVYPVVERVVHLPTDRLSEFNAGSIIQVCQYLDVQTIISTDMTPFLELEASLSDDEQDIAVRFPHIQLKRYEKKIIRLIEICRVEGATTFINAIGGQALYDRQECRRNGIDLFFIKTKPHTYRQHSRVFYPNLSIIDVLMNCGRAGTQQLLHHYDLIEGKESL